MKRTSVLVTVAVILACIFALSVHPLAEASGMMFCPECGRQIETGSKFCMFCGQPIVYYDSGTSGDSHTSSGETIELYVGKKILFGSYEQDNRTSNGAEDITWRVLAIEGHKVLLLSDQILEAVAFNTRDMSVTWDCCTLRDWLNNTFYYEAFSSSDRNLICSTYLTDQRNSKYGTAAGAGTTDKVFALSIDEVQRYLPYTSDRATTATDYCLARLKSIRGYNGVWWWLRSPGSSGNRAAGVYADPQSNGTVDYEGAVVDHAYNGVRPAVWIDTSDLSNVTIPSSDRPASSPSANGLNSPGVSSQNNGSGKQTGKTVCWKCNGKMYCTYCYGTGTWLNYNAEYESCPFCAGLGHCWVCHGTGYTDY